MDTTTALLLILGVWLLTGLLLGFSMRRRGHNFWVWFALGAIIGPLAIPLAINNAHRQSSLAPSIPLAALPGRFDVLAGIDGSKESEASVVEALKLFGGSITSLTLATVLDFEASGAYTGEQERRKAQELLEQAAERIGFRPVVTAVLHGKPADALMEYARKAETELIVVGARGHGLSEAMFGSVTAKLVGGYDIPVFVGPRTDALAKTSTG